MKTFDPDDYAASIDRVVELCEEMEEKKSYRAALKAQTALTVMKAIIGNSKFETLPSFDRWLTIATKIVSKHDRENQND